MDGQGVAMITELPRRPRPGASSSGGGVPTNQHDEIIGFADDDSDMLYDLACECEALLDARLAELKNQQSPLAELLAEYQQRFAIWAAHLGVFARKSQSLDKRLENYPDMVDLAARLLDILRRSLAQLSKPTKLRAEGISQQLANNDQRSRDAALTALEATLSRLNRLGVTIRQASRGRMVLKVQKMATTLDLRSFTDSCRSVVQLQSRRPTRSPGLMPTIGEGEELSLRPLQPDRNAQAEPGRENQAPTAQPQRPSAASQSDLSTINSKQLRQAMRRTNYLETPTQRPKGTSSIQVSQGNYPPPPFQKNANIASCGWCGKPMDKREITESEWRRHTDDDLKPYPCISEECPDGHPVFQSFGIWYSHMQSHKKRWHQRVYVTPGWVCAVCEDSHDVYRSAGALYLHLTEAHHDMFDASRLHAISRQSKVERPRAWNECLLCCFTVEEVTATGLPKRQKKQLHQHSGKRLRTTLEIGDSSSPREVGDSSDDSDDSLDVENKLASDDAEMMARHIAGHLQALMLLTIRLASLQNEEDDNDDGQDANSDSVDLGDTSDTSEATRTRTNDPGEATDRGTPEDIEMPDADEVPDHAVLLSAHSSIPDADVDFTEIGVRRQYDDLAAEKDGFLQELIKSGAYQAHLDGDFGEGGLEESAYEVIGDWEDLESLEMSPVRSPVSGTIPDILLDDVRVILPAEEETYGEKKMGEKIEPGDTMATRNAVQNEANRYYREKKMAEKLDEDEIRSRSASLTPSVVDKYEPDDERADGKPSPLTHCEPCDFYPTPHGRRRKMEKHMQTARHRRMTGQEYLVRSATPPVMKRRPKENQFDGPNADVLIDNVILPHDLVKLQSIPPASACGLGRAMVPVVVSEDPSCEPERPMLNLVLPTPRSSPPLEKVKAKQAAAVVAPEEAPSEDETMLGSALLTSRLKQEFPGYFLES
ncbi:hypothetical protein N658DRAFT_351035 [Parathielavia hyrcaniae]|uniref:Uncharacterized protein n=1 Tax=Parathielavia hyrcaniae TaxID=113614 RepID=A0AAN6Q218_9PEZI|nr:hypothetical protein N658DRAFT_351035 [Parathielavia hyrcaniae]